MSMPAIKLEVLPVSFGDCLLVSCPVGQDEWRMLVDTGPDETYLRLRDRLLSIPRSADGKRHIDLFVVTHIDHDHIGAASQLLADAALELEFGDIWFNAPPQRATRGVAEGESLASLLGSTARQLPWNVAWSGRPVVTPALGGGVELTAPGHPKVTVLSPTPERLEDLYRVWAKELERLRMKWRDVPEPSPAPSRGGEDTLEALAGRYTAMDSAVANGSSIAMLVEHQGASVLLCADAFSSVMTPALRALAARRGLTGPLHVDAIKLAHHGSRANVTREMLAEVTAEHFVFSTNGAYFKHPDGEAVARVILNGGKPRLWFNHDTPQTRRWGTEELIGRYGHQAHYPPGDGIGVTLELLAKP
jgi:beta-lactamase superfamily II metal-dependent hydrolase